MNTRAGESILFYSLVIALTTPQAVAPADRVEKTNVIVKAMTKTMVEALKIPHFGYKDEVMKMIRLIIIGVHIILDLKEEEIGRQLW